MYLKVKKIKYEDWTLNLKFGTYLLTLLGLFLIFSCKNTEVDQENIVARVNDKYLSREDLKRNIPQYIKGNDSIEFVKNYISKWAKKNLMLKKAYINLSDEEIFDLEQQVEDYKNTLLVHRYEQKLISQKSDTSVSNSEIEEYYNANMLEFKLDKTIIKSIYIKIKKVNNNYTKIKNLTWSDDEDKKNSLEELCTMNADTFFLQNDWFELQHLNSLLPSPIQDLESFIKYSKVYETQDSLYKYLLNIKELKTKNEIAPLSFISGQLKSLIQNRKKILLIKETENNLYEDAVRTKNFETYK